MSLNGFEPIVGEQPKLMILGSMPSVTSLEKQEYYGFAHNRFWRIISHYFQEELPDYEAKKACIKKHGILLWDVIRSCEREGSLDSAIRKVVCNDIKGMLREHPSIVMVICNGKKSYDLYQKHVGKDVTIPCVCLPSTSNANRTIKEADLFYLWEEQLHKVIAKR